jgi:zinc protease
VEVDKVAAAMNAEILQVAAQGVSAAEVERAKAKLRAQVAYARDSYRTGAHVIGAALATGETLADVEDWPQRIAAVTTDQVNEAAHAILRDERSVTGMLLPAAPGEGPVGEGGPAQPPSSMGRELR